MALGNMRMQSVACVNRENRDQLVNHYIHIVHINHDCWLIPFNSSEKGKKAEFPALSNRLIFAMTQVNYKIIGPLAELCNFKSTMHESSCQSKKQVMASWNWSSGKLCGP